MSLAVEGKDRYKGQLACIDYNKSRNNALISKVHAWRAKYMNKVMLAKVLGIGMFCLLLVAVCGYRQKQENEIRESMGTKVLQEDIAQEDAMSDAKTKNICLTFDDGPHPYYTEQLLDGLKERGVKATFFVTGEHAALHPDIIKRMSEEGHVIGNHTYSHIQLRSSNKEQFKAELIKTNEVIEEITGEEVVYVRPPYGSWDKTFEKELNMIPVLWSIDPLDWCSNDAVCVAGKVIDKARENDIILLHDYYESSVTAALEIVDELLEEGFVFVTVEEILFD